MKRYLINPSWALLITLFLGGLASGCAPAISKQVLGSADRSLTLVDLATEPELHTGKTVVLGGTILNVENFEHESVVEVLEQPLNKSLKPVRPKQSRGRFLVVFDGFIDPVLYSKGKLVTVAGTFQGLRKGTIGATSYFYPVVEPKEHYLWKSDGGEPRVSIGVGVFGSF